MMAVLPPLRPVHSPPVGPPVRSLEDHRAAWMYCFQLGMRQKVALLRVLTKGRPEQRRTVTTGFRQLAGRRSPPVPPSTRTVVLLKLTIGVLISPY